MSHHEHQTKEVGVVFPACNHLSALNLHLALPLQVMALVKPDGGGLFLLLLFFSKDKTFLKGSKLNASHAQLHSNMKHILCTN